MKIKHLIWAILLSFLGAQPSRAQTASSLYYQFNSGSLAPTTGSGSLTGGGSYAIGNSGPVGSYLDMDNLNAQYMTGGSVTLTNGFTCQMLFKAGKNYDKRRNGRILTVGGVAIEYQYPYLKFYSELASGAQQSIILTMDKPGVGSWDSLFNNCWHHLAFVHNTSGKMAIWIDGKSPTALKANVTAGNLNAGGQVALSWGIDYVRMHAQVDEIAIYGTALDSLQIYQNYQDYLAGNHYTTANAVSVPTSTQLTLTFDTLEFAKRTTLPTVGTVTTNAGPTALQQLQKFPVPRYREAFKPDTRRLFNWCDINYMGGSGQSGQNSTTVAAAVSINLELAKRWNYYLIASGNVAPGNNYTNVSTEFGAALAKCANDNPTLPACAITFRAQINGNHPILGSANMPDNHYLRNSSLQFIGKDGQVPGTKTWSPLAPTAPYNGDGDYMKQGLSELIAAMPNRPATKKLDMINENGEILYPYTSATMDKDPEIRAAYQSLVSNAIAFRSKKFAEMETQSYRDRFMTLPGLAQTKFTYYGLCGRLNVNNEPEFVNTWNEVRNMGSPIVNNQRFSTTDVYTRWPYNWKTWSTAWHGLKWIAECRGNEISKGDSLFSPYVSAGWSGVEEENIRPAQWLGLLKCLVMYGSDFFYTGFFNIVNPYPDPKNWIWQAADASYAQATMSRIGGYLKNGVVLPGDNPVDPVDEALGNPRKNYTFYTGHPNRVVMVRQARNASSGALTNSYAIMGTIQPYSNYKNTTPMEDTVSIVHNGSPLNIMIRRQGRTYIYDKTDAANPVFYQVDAEHEYKHPSYWSNTFLIEAENFDNGVSNKVIKTENTNDNLNGDYTSYTTYATMSSSDTGLSYYFTPRDTNATYYVWVKAKKTGTTDQTFNLNIDGLGGKKVKVTSTSWAWYSVPTTGGRIAFTGIAANVNHKLRLLKNLNVKFDKIFITADVSETPN